MEQTIKIVNELPDPVYAQIGQMAAYLACLENGNLTLANQFADQLGISLDNGNDHNRAKAEVFYEE